jgi:hypothetical protein
VYAPSAVELILTMCARQSYLIQIICDEIVHQAALTGNRSITVSAVESAAMSDAVVKNKNCRYQWQSIGSAQLYCLYG